jgi:hypothetical protein
MPTYDPLESHTWATSTSPNSDYGSRAFIEHIRRQREQMARQEAAQRQQQMEMEARQRAEIDARVRDFQASITEDPNLWAADVPIAEQFAHPPAPTIEEVRAHIREQQTARPFVPMDFTEFRASIGNNRDPVINNPEKPGRSPF